MEVRATQQDQVSREGSREGGKREPMEFMCFVFVVLSLFSLGTDKQHSVERTVFNSFSDACLAAGLKFVAKRT